MPLFNTIVRNKLALPWKKILKPKSDMAEDSHMPSEILNRYNFDFIPQCDFNILDSASANLS